MSQADKIARLKETMLNMYALPRKTSPVIAIINQAHRELFKMTGEVFSNGSFMKAA